LKQQVEATGTTSRDLVEAREQQAATSEILRVISASRDDVQPVFDLLAQRAGKLCNAHVAVVSRFDGEVIHLAAIHGVATEAVEIVRSLYPMAVDAPTVTSRTVRSADIVHVGDVLADQTYGIKEFARAAHYRAGLGVPVMQDGRVIGTIFVGRTVPGLFTPAQVELLRTFAQQAAIAIENARVFAELSESLRHQTATNEVLRVISRSAFDLDNVLHTLVESAARLCDAEHGTITRQRDGVFYRAESYGFSQAFMSAVHTVPVTIDRASATGRALVEGRIVHIADVNADPEYAFDEALRTKEFRTVVSVPMMREGVAVGVLALTRAEVRPFTDRQIALLSTFADQAVIAIENARLFNELGARNRELTEALEQQTATSDILRVISRSPRDVQPVFDTIAAAAHRLCGAETALVTMVDGDVVRLVASVNTSAETERALHRRYPRPRGRDTAMLRAIETGSVVVIPDTLSDPEYDHADSSPQFRSSVGVPLVRNGVPIGAIGLGRLQSGVFTERQIALLQTFADQAIIAIENVRLFREIEARNRDLTEALEQQTATSDILRVISQSQTDVQPVFDTIAGAALKLCGATSALVTRVDGDDVALVASANLTKEGAAAMRETFPMPISRRSTSARAILEAHIVTIPDVLTDPEYEVQEHALRAAFRSTLAVPLMRESRPIGTITVGKPEPGRFSESQVALLQTFAEQAVIAIENVRLFRELEARNHDLVEALEQQTATSGILRVISTSRTDVKPVFETIAQSALTLCGASSSAVTMLDGGLIHIRALASTTKEGADAIRAIFPRPPSRDNATTRALLTRQLIEIPDVTADAEFATTSRSLAAGFRSVLSVPLLREGAPVGAITVGRPLPGAFPSTQVELLRTFADQALIAIENVRLFTELQARNRDLSESLEQQTATSDILRVISRSQTDVQPVFDTIAGAALKLCRASAALVTRVEHGSVVLVASANLSEEGAIAVREAFPMAIGRGNTSARAVAEGQLVVIPDVLADDDFAVKSQAVRSGFRSSTAVPLMRDGRPIGAITVGKPDPGAFPESQVALLQTFAEQAVIAIENVRLFTELEARTAQLSRSVSELRALGDVGRAVSSTLDLETVLSTIVARATELTGVDGGSIYEYDEAREAFHLHTSDRLPQEIVDALRANPIRKGEGVLGRMALTGAPVQIVDLVDRSQYQSRVRDVLMKHGYRSILAVPLMRDDQLLGGLAVNRRAAGAFDPQVIELLKTFAAQSAIALQNARLFREIESKSRALETASRHKSEFLANMSHELRTPLNAIIGFSEVLGERLFGTLNDKQAEYVTDIADSGRHLLALINDILDLSKIEAGRMELDAADFDLAKAVAHAASLVRERAERRGIALSTHCDDGIGMINGDERKVKQVLLNLLSNALKFTPEGGRVDIGMRRVNGSVEVSVSDTGVGIAAEDRDAVFEEFRQVGANAARVEGTGLGLAISRKFIELHGGRIRVESEVGKGSTFTFSLPLR
jgi:GAF domain-containing protein